MKCSWGKHDTVSLVFQFAFLCVFDSAAASTPNTGTVGMFTRSSSWRAHLLVHIFFSPLIAAKRTSTRGKRGLTKRSWNWPQTFDCFLASEKERNVLL